MKRALIFFFTLFLCTPFWGQDAGVFHFTSPLEGWADTIYIAYDQHKEKAFVRKNGIFDFTLPLQHVATIDIADSNYGIKIDGDPKVDRFIAVPGEHLILNGGTAYSGSPFYEKYSTVLHRLSSWGFMDPAVDSIRAYIKRHPNDEMSVVMLTDWRAYPLTVNEAQVAFATLSADVRNGRMGTYFRNMMKIRMEQEKEQQHMGEASGKLLQEGSVAPDFHLMDSEGRWHSLHDFRGKYVLLDFWGTWCAACQMALPELKEFAARNSTNTVVISLACFDNERRWRACIAKNGMNWVNILVPESSDILNKYAISKFPTTVYISPEGEVMGIDYKLQ